LLTGSALKALSLLPDPAAARDPSRSLPLPFLTLSGKPRQLRYQRLEQTQLLSTDGE
jgi:hypothetical protein